MDMSLVSLPPPPPMSVATPLRDTMTFTSTKGLLNEPGQNNCFLNSAVQVLWHLDIFRRSFRDLSGHACMADSCIFCALKELFSQLQFSTETALPPDVLRRALAESFFDQNRFQLGFMDDAAECFENILLRIHAHIAEGTSEDMCDAGHCVPHRKFAMTLVEQIACCECGATSEPLSYTQMVHYISTSTLVYQVRANVKCPPLRFGQLLLKAGNMGDIRTCPSACGAVIQVGHTLMNRPEIVSIGLVWNSERPTLEHIMEVFSSIGTTIRLADVFSTVVDSRWAETSVHNLVGVVTYYGKHYSTFFFHTKLRVWIYFDDATVREIGPRWDQVVEKCRKGRYQPLLLLYALPDGTPVNTENAPKNITSLCNNKVNTKPQQSVLRRSVTPSPEKPITGTTRRAITPNPDRCPINQKPSIAKIVNEYQNLSVIQSNLSQAQGIESLDANKGEPEYTKRKTLDFGKSQRIQRTPSNGSSSGIEGISIPNNMNVPRRRDSGNWSGDRNSASSASSTTMENPYLYLIGKVPHGIRSVPGSPTKLKSDSSSGSVYDAGYDSYSLSSNDSSNMTTLQHLIKMGHLTKIPEDYNTAANQVSQSCDVLCNEADGLLVKSRQLEDEHDLVLALALCNAAATKARAAMNAPYNNPQTLTLARMKHNTCIMRARSLHRRMTQTQASNKDNPPEIRHTREGSSSSGRHSRQNSRDKGNHSRQNSRELLVTETQTKSVPKNIEIYATLPKKRDSLKNKLSISIDDDEVNKFQNKPTGRESRSIFFRSKNKDSKTREKRSRSEDRNKITRDFSITPEIVAINDTSKKAKEEKEDKKDNDGKSKKQHKIRRKLLMGGLIKRKNRSMPDLTDATAHTETDRPTTTVDDSNVGLTGSSENSTNMCGYLSEGHLEFVGNNPNPNLERSKLMRKSFHSSAGKMLTAAKVPPPPPLRTTSQLSKSKFNVEEVCDKQKETGHLYNNNFTYSETQDYHFVNEAPASLPYMNNCFSNDRFHNQSPNTFITHADVHQEKTAPITEINSRDEVDFMPCHGSLQNLDLPPYPSPLGSIAHSRQNSEDFPLPPPPLDISTLNEHLIPQPITLLAQLQKKRQQIMSQDNDVSQINTSVKSSGETWLKELQAKQAALRNKQDQNSSVGVDVVNTQRYKPNESKVESVKELASKFEKSEMNCMDPITTISGIKNENNGLLSMKKRDYEHIPPEQIAEEIREVNMLSAVMQKTLNLKRSTEEDKKQMTKKKSVSFCDQVILVATADEQEDDSYIPNPILERVLRTAMNKSEVSAIKEILALRENELDTNVAKLAENNIPIAQRNSSELTPERNVATPQTPSITNQPLYNGQSRYMNQSPHHFNGQLNSYENNMQCNNNFYSQSSCQYNQCYSGNNQTGIYNSSQKMNYPLIGQECPYNVQPTYICNGGLPSQCSNSCSANLNGHCESQPEYTLSPYQHPHQNTLAYTNYCSTNGNKVNSSIQNTHTYPSPPQFQPEIVQPSPSPMSFYAKNNPHTQRQYPNIHKPVSSESFHGSNYIQEPQTCVVSPQEHPKLPYRRYMPTVNDCVSDNYNYQKQSQNSPYMRVPLDMHSSYSYSNDQLNNMHGDVLYQKTHQVHNAPQNLDDNFHRNNTYQRIPHRDYEVNSAANSTELYQRLKQSHGDPEIVQATKYSPYQPVPAPAHDLKKSVSFEPGIKGGCESPLPKAIVTPIVVNNANNSVPTDKTKCNLCRKKNVVALNLYCQNCEFYMSKFKPRS